MRLQKNEPHIPSNERAKRSLSFLGTLEVSLYLCMLRVITILTNAENIVVSKRIMPQIKKVLSLDAVENLSAKVINTTNAPVDNVVICFM
jgi:hypothetical protein